ncbi:MAG: hypothetical protein M3O26_20385 [Pseudomonadota bacterium]|nr:hypothetical protein [Pseudomonadota bacterium]
MLSIPLLLKAARLVFFAALIFTFYSAIAPAAHVLRLTPWDKATHFIAFYVLTALAVAAFPKRNLLLIAALLSAFGALIEIVQGMPQVRRDRDFWDWVADTVAIASALLPMAFCWWRAQARGTQK